MIVAHYNRQGDVVESLDNRTSGRCKGVWIGRKRHEDTLFYWKPGTAKLREMTCPICGASLGQTTRLFRGRYVRLFAEDVARAKAAR